MAKVMLFGEPMALFIAEDYAFLKDAETFKRALAGAELNVCIGLNRLEHTPVYITKLGEKDPFGEYIYEGLKKEGMDLSGISFDPEHFTGFMLKSKAKSGDPEIFYFRRNTAASNLSPKDIDRISFEGVSHVHITGIPCALSNSCRLATLRLIERAKENQIYISFDPNLRPSLWENEAVMVNTLNDIACRCDMVMPGVSEGKALTGFGSPEEIADYYLSRGVSDVVVKLGPEGAFVKNAELTRTISPFPVGKIVDTVGAGDGFAGGVISGRIEGLSLEEAVMRGNIIGALQLTVSGDNEGLPNRKILNKMVSTLTLNEC